MFILISSPVDVAAKSEVAQRFSPTHPGQMLHICVCRSQLISTFRWFTFVRQSKNSFYLLEYYFVNCICYSIKFKVMHAGLASVSR
jgi:hypothetical protein